MSDADDLKIELLNMQVSNLRVLAVFTLLVGVGIGIWVGWMWGALDIAGNAVHCAHLDHPEVLAMCLRNPM